MTVKEFYRHYRIPFRHERVSGRYGLGLESRGGVTLFVRMELHEWATPDPSLPEVHALSVGFAVCSLRDNYCKAAGRAIARVRQRAGFTGARKPDERFYGRFPSAPARDVEAVLQRQAEVLAGFVYRKHTRLIRSGAPLVIMGKALSR